MRKDEEWGYYRYDLRYDPFFQMRVAINNAISPSYPMADLHWERIERECITDTVDPDLPTLEDLGVTLTAMEDQVPWELRPQRHALYYAEDDEEFTPPPAPPRAVA